MTYKEHKVMLSRPLSTLTEEHFKEMRDAGIDGIEVSPRQHEYDTMDLLPIKALADRYGITLWSFHLRFCDFEGYDIANLDGAERRHAIEYAKAYIKKAAEDIRKNAAELLARARLTVNGRPIENLPFFCM